MANPHPLEQPAEREPGAGTAPLLTIVHSLGEAAADWRALGEGIATPFQTLDWHRAAVAAEPDRLPVIAVGRNPNGEPLFVMPLALERQGPVQLLRWLAGAQASYGGGIFRADFAAGLDAPGVERLIARIAAAAPPADAFVLGDQRDDMAGNPLALLPRVAGAGEGFSVTLGRWEEVYAARSSRRARHNDRRRERRLAELGPWRVAIANEGAERRRLMATMFDQKRAWMRDRGIDDFLADEATRELFLGLAAAGPGSEIEPVVNALMVADEIAAVSFGLIHRKRYYSLISSVTAEERLHPYSPGDVLLRHVIEAMCGRGIEHYDLGIGSTQLKEHYADRRFRLFHTLVPITVEGRIYVAALRAHYAAKRAIKESPTLWRLFQRARRVRGTLFGGR